MQLYIRSIFAALLIWTIALSSFSCKESAKKAGINPPFTKARIPYIEYEVDAEKGQEIKLSNGTVITIPANAFSDAKGNSVSGNVIIKYREFHTSGQIIASGIPMLYDSAGKIHHFESAGMFDIQGFTKDNKPLKMADGKNITVKMASYRKENNFSFYKYEEGQGWNYLGISQAEPNIAKQEQIAALGPVPEKPVQPRKANKNALVFDLNVNYALFPELKEFVSVMWQYAGTDPATDPEKNAWLFDKKWDSVSLVSENRDSGTYTLNLTTSGRSFQTIVKPVLRGENYQKALEDFKKKADAYNLRMDKELNLRRQADVFRTFQLSGFGIYNWDRIYKMPYAVAFPASVQTDDYQQDEIPTIFLISGDERVVVAYKNSDLGLFSFNPREKNALLAVLPDDKIAVFSSADFKKLDIEKIKADKNYTFEMKTLDKVIETVENLDEIINSL